MAEDSQAAQASTQANPSSAKATEGEATTPVYEIGFHVVPTVGEDGAAKVVEAIRTALKGAEIISEGFPQKMTLAYTIERATQGKREKYTESYFGFIKFALEREGIIAIEAALRGMRDIMRFIVIKTTREDYSQAPRRAVFASDRLEGQTLQKPQNAPEKGGEVSEEELQKSIEALTG